MGSGELFLLLTKVCSLIHRWKGIIGAVTDWGEGKDVNE